MQRRCEQIQKSQESYSEWLHKKRKQRQEKPVAPKAATKLVGLAFNFSYDYQSLLESSFVSGYKKARIKEIFMRGISRIITTSSYPYR